MINQYEVTVPFTMLLHEDTKHCNAGVGKLSQLLSLSLGHFVTQGIEPTSSRLPAVTYQSK